MFREVNKDSTFDVVIIGGGINGCACALDSASRGFSTLLVERSDFGSKTSAACFKIIHGGLRYLQHLDIKRVLESLNEQKWLRLAAPHLVRPLPFLIPTYSDFRRSKIFLGAGLSLYRLIDFNRNSDLQGAEELPGFKVLSKEQTLEIAPHLSQEGLTGSVVYYDCQVAHCERLTWLVAKTAARHGAKIVNYTELSSFEKEDGKIKSLRLKDLATEQEYSVFAKQVIFAAGPWNEKFLSMLGMKANQDAVYSKGLQFAVPKLVENYALAVDSTYKDPEAVVASGGRKLFIQPWKDLSLIGTSDSISKEKPDSFEITEKELRELFEEVKKAYPDPRWDFEKIVFAFGGLRPLSDEAVLDRDSQDSKTSRRPMIEDLGENVVVVTGIKYTTFRLLAEQVLDLVTKKLGRKEKSKTRKLKLIGAELSKRQVVQQVLDEYPTFRDTEVLYHTYGAELLNVLEYFKSDLRMAEACFAAENELCMTLADIVFRRTNICQQGLAKKEFIEQLVEKLSEIGFAKKEVLSQQAQELQRSLNLNA